MPDPAKPTTGRNAARVRDGTDGLTLLVREPKPTVGRLTQFSLLRRQGRLDLSGLDGMRQGQPQRAGLLHHPRFERDHLARRIHVVSAIRPVRRSRTRDGVDTMFGKASA